MTTSNSKRIHIGWAQRDITPKRAINLYGMLSFRITERVKDPLTVTALTLTTPESPESAMVWVSCDCASVPGVVQECCRARIRERVPELNAAHVIIHATHTHNSLDIHEGNFPPVPPGVSTPKENIEVFVAQVADAVEESWKTRRPGGICWGLGQSVVGHNRRIVYFDDLSKRPGGSPSWGGGVSRYALMGGNPNDPMFSHVEGYEDHTVNLLFTLDEADRLTGMVVNLACPSQVSILEPVISADFWHEARTEIRKRHGEQLFILPQCSAAGDQGPYDLVYLAHGQAEKRMLSLTGLSLEDALRQGIGRRIADAVDTVWPLAAKDIRRAEPLRHTVRTVALPRRIITDEEAATARAGLRNLQQPSKPPPPNADPRKILIGESSRYVMTRRFERVITRYEEQGQTPTQPEEIHVIRFGDMAFTTSRFELYLDFGIRIKARSPAVQTFVVQLAGGGRTGTYLPTARAEYGGSYGASPYCSDIGSAGGQVLVEETVKTLKELFPEANAKSK